MPDYKPVIAHFKSLYLNLTETFIYQNLIKIERFNPVFVTEEVINLESFPFSNLHCSSNPQYVIKRQKARLIHAHFGTEGVKILPVKRKLKLPLITSFYGVDMSNCARQRGWQTAYKNLFKYGDLFLAEGNHMRKGLIDLGCPSEKIRIQHIGIDINKFNYRKRELKDKNKKIKILFCGRFIEKKGLIYALKAVKLIIGQYPNLEFRVIGDGELRPDIEAFIKEQNLEKHVTLLGYKLYHVFAQELQKAHILLQPSVTAQNGDSEGGSPVVLLEAQASGLPVISTCHADIPEVVLDGESGFLVPERSPEEIAKKLRALIDNPEMWEELGRNGRAHIEKNYSIYVEVKKLEGIYGQLIK